MSRVMIGGRAMQPCKGGCGKMVRADLRTGRCLPCVNALKASGAHQPWRKRADELAAQGMTIAEVARQVGKSHTTVGEYLRGITDRGHAASAEPPAPYVPWPAGRSTECPLPGFCSRNPHAVEAFHMAERVMLRQMTEAGVPC